MRGILFGGPKRSRPAGERGVVWVAAAIAAGWLLLVLPLVLGERTLVLRDVIVTHLPYKAFGAAQLALGELPAIFPAWGLGQPFRGNPNALAFYPGNLAYLLLPFWSALNLHYVLHWALAAAGVAALARRYAMGWPAALFAALAFAGSGYVLSTLTFYNLVAVAAWAPWTLAGLARGGMRGLALAGLACGLMLLSGEPLTAAILVPAMAAVATERHGWRRGMLLVAAAGALGLAVAAPQLVATARVLPESWRAVHGIDLRQVAANDLHPLRLLELLLPLPWGWPTDWNRFAYWAPRVTPHLPYIFSIHFGIVACALALGAARRRPRWAALAAAGLALAWALGLSAEATRTLTLGLFRYPQKFLVLTALFGALLAGAGFERAVAGEARPRRWALAAAACAAVAGTLWLAYEPFVGALEVHLVAGHDAVVARTQAGHWIVLVLAAALLLAGAAWAIARRSAAALLALEAVALLQLAPAWASVPVAELREPSPWAQRIRAASGGAPAGVLAVAAAFPYWEARQAYLPEVRHPAGKARIARLDLEPAFATFYGLDAPLAPDLEGLTTARSVALARRLAAADWGARVAWLRRLNVGWVTRNREGSIPGLEPVDTVDRFGAATTLFALRDPLPALRWPAGLVMARDGEAAFRVVADGEVGESVAVVERPVEHHPGARLELLEERPDRVVFRVEGDGGVAVLARAYSAIYAARFDEDQAAATLPVDLALLGVEVPAGRHVVTVDVDARPERRAAWLALVATLAALAGLVAGGVRRQAAAAAP